MGWNLNLSDDITVRLVDFPPDVVSGIAVENGVLWSRLIDDPLKNLGASCALIAWARSAHGLPIPPLATVEQAFDAMAAMFELVEEGAQPVEQAG